MARAALPVQAFTDEGIVRRVLGEVPVLDQGVEQSSALPPFLGERAGDGVAGAVVVEHHGIGGGHLGSFLEGLCCSLAWAYRGLSGCRQSKTYSRS